MTASKLVYYMLSIYTCIALLITQSAATYQHWLQQTSIPRYLHIARATHVQDIIDRASLQFGGVITNQVAKKLKSCLLKDDIQSSTSD